ARRATTVVALGSAGLPAGAVRLPYAWTTTMTASIGTAAGILDLWGYRALRRVEGGKGCRNARAPGEQPAGVLLAPKLRRLSSASPPGSARAVRRPRTRGGPPRTGRHAAPGSAARPSPRRGAPRATCGPLREGLPSPARSPWEAQSCECRRGRRRAPSP